MCILSLFAIQVCHFGCALSFYCYVCVCHLFVMLLSFWVEKKQKSLKNDSQSGKCKKNDSQSGKGNKKIQKNDSTKQELQKKLKT